MNISEKIASLMARAKQPPLQKSTFNIATDLVQYDLTPLAYQTYPVPTPLRNMIPRRKGSGGNAVHWKSITAVNPSGIAVGVGEGHRGGEIGVTLVNKTAPYSVIGLEASVTFEADEAAEGYDNARARATESLLNSMMIGEEKVILGGNSSTGLGTPPTPTIAQSATAGTIPAATYRAWVVALTLEGYQNASVANGVPLAVTRTNLDGTTDSYGGGSSNVSAQSSTQALDGAHGADLTVAAVPGACAYAWYLGTSAATAALAAITTINKVTLTVAPAGTQTASQIVADNSKNSLVFDGIIPQLTAAGSGAYFKSLDGAALTSDGAAGINEIDVALQSLYDTARLGVQQIWVSSQEQKSLKKLIVANGGAPLVRFTMDAGSGSAHEISAGAIVGSYLNEFTGELIPIKIHPNLPAGTMLGLATSLPYPVSNVPEPFIIRTRRDYYEIPWPVTTRRYDHGVYASEMLEYRTPFAAFVLANILKS